MTNNVAFLTKMYSDFSHSTLKLIKYNQMLIEGYLTPEDYFVLVDALANKNLASLKNAPIIAEEIENEQNNMQA